MRANDCGKLFLKAASRIKLSKTEHIVIRTKEFLFVLIKSAMLFGRPRKNNKTFFIFHPLVFLLNITDEKFSSMFQSKTYEPDF